MGQSIPGRTIRGRRFRALACLALVFALSSCAWLAAQGPKVRRSEKRLPSRIEAIGVPQFVNAPGVMLNDADREFLRKQIRAKFEEHPPLRTFDAAPSKLPGTAQLSGQITGYRSTDTKGSNVFVRTIDIEVWFELSYLASQDEPLRFSRAYSYQHAYLPSETISTQLFDFQNAALEFAGLVFAEFFPSTVLDDFDAVSAHDVESGLNVDVPRLQKANSEAKEGRYTKAVALWEQVLFNPNGSAVQPQFKLGRLALGMISEQGVPDSDLQLILDLVKQGPLPHEGFRAELRGRFQATSPYEDKISEWSDYAAFQAHTNAAAAHMNLGNLYSAWRQLDLAVYHFGMAWAHSRSESALEKWNHMQGERKLIPEGTVTDGALRLYLLLPPPGTSNHLPGSFDEIVLPPSKVRMEGIQDQIRRVAGNAPPPPPQPVALPGEAVDAPPAPVQPAAPAAPPPRRKAGSQAPKDSGATSPAPRAAQPAGVPAAPPPKR